MFMTWHVMFADRDVIRKDPDMMKAPFRPLIPDELLPLKADNVGTISHLHRRFVQSQAIAAGN